MRRSGCIAYVHTVADKISPRATKGVLLGYALGTKGYRVWILEDEKVVVSKDVVLNEEKLYKQREEATELTVDEAKATNPKKRVSFKKELEEFEPEDTEGESSAQGGAMKINDPINHSDSSDSEEDCETTSQEEEEDLSEYILAKDRAIRHIKPPSKYGDRDLVAYALASAEEIEIEEPKHRLMLLLVQKR